MSALLRKPQLLARRDEAILSGRPAAEVERREILLEGLIDMGSRALHDRLETDPFDLLTLHPFAKETGVSGERDRRFESIFFRHWLLEIRGTESSNLICSSAEAANYRFRAGLPTLGSDRQQPVGL